MQRPSGIVRRFDQVRRITSIDELRTHQDGKIIFMKYAPTCLICSSSVDLVEFKDKYVCRECIKETKAV